MIRPLHSIILEYLTDSQRRQYASIKVSPEARAATDHFFGENNDTVRMDVKVQHHKSDVHKEIERTLQTTIPVEQYLEGKATDRYGRAVSIGKLIRRNKDLTDRYSADLEFAKKQQTGFYSTVVRGTEVAGQANPVPNESHPRGHRWHNASCKNIVDGQYRHFLPDEIERGTVVTFIHDAATGEEVYRATHHPYTNIDGHVVYDVNSEYGLQHPDFTKHAHEISRQLSPLRGHDGEKMSLTDPYFVDGAVYNDADSEAIFHPRAEAKHLNYAARGPSYDDHKALLRHPKVNEHQIDDLLSNKNALSSVKVTALNHPLVNSRHITTALSYSTNGAANHSAVPLQALQLVDKITPEHISLALKYPNTDVRVHAVGHPQANSQHVMDALTDSDNRFQHSVRHAAAMSHAFGEEHLHHMLSNISEYSDHLDAAFNNPHVPTEAIKAINLDEVAKGQQVHPETLFRAKVLQKRRVFEL